MSEQADTEQVAEKVPFKYGKCLTDHKSGNTIRSYYRSIDYMNDEPYASKVQEILEQLGLPLPKSDEIFRGTHHDMLFLDNHGVVLRIGPTDVQDLMNPGIVQPLGWIEDKELKLDHGGIVPFTVTVYPGIELYTHYLQDDKRPEVVGDLDTLFAETGQGSSDMSDENLGVIRLKEEDGTEVAVKMLLDADNKFNGTRSEKATEKNSHFSSVKQSGGHKGEAMEITLGSIFEAAKNVPLYKRAFQLHQPLRNLFWQAFKNADTPGVTPDIVTRDRFWQECAAVTNRPKTITLHETATYQMSDGKVTRSKQTKPVEVVLYRPWTGKDEDNVGKIRATLATNGVINITKEQGRARQREKKSLREQLLFHFLGSPPQPSKQKKSSTSSHPLFV